MPLRRLAVVLCLLAAVGAAPAASAGSTAGSAGPLPTCDRMPDPGSWGGGSGARLDRPLIAAHRGAAELAPENTLPALEYAVAYGVDVLEIDVQQTADGRYVLFHDLDVEPKTDGTGRFPLLTFAQARSLNAADNDRWRGSAYDPTPMPSLEEALALAAEHEVGLYFDLKESVTNTAAVANLAAEYGVLERSIFTPYVPGRTEQILAVQPEATVMFTSYAEQTPPVMLHALTREYDWFGGSLPNYPAASVDAVHDGCGLLMPTVYQGDVTGSERGDLLHALELGMDGAMVNNPDVAAAALGRPVATTLVAQEGGRACLLGRSGLGLPEKPLQVGGRELVTGRGGCVTRPGNAPVRFAGDGSALPSSLR
jgi:glycerophosphoryl diester phosphodiesterase